MARQWRRLWWVACLLSVAGAVGCKRGGGEPAPGPAAASSQAASGAPASAPPSAPAFKTQAGPPPAELTVQPAVATPARAGFSNGPAPEACADCHPDHVEGFRKTGMGRSLYRPQSRPAIEDFTPEKATVKHPKTGAIYTAYVDDAGRWWQSEATADGSYRRAVEVKYVVGSGNHTRSYIGEQEGELVELPLTWYSRRKIWDMSPGYQHRNHMRFDRPIKAECSFCHNGLSPLRAETMAGYQAPFAEGIGCDRCHGDGQAHVDARMDGKDPPEGQPDPTIFNPKHTSSQRQLEICQQCHLQGETRLIREGHTWDKFDPRVPLGDYMQIFTYAKDGGAEFSIASHGHRLSLSKCFTASEGKLTCTTCHDPHQPSSEGKPRYGGCVQCHAPKDCGDEHGAAEGKDCARCHMKHGGTSDIPHVNFTDHLIRRKLGDEDIPPKPFALELVDALEPHRTVPMDPVEAQIRLGIAHEEVWRFQSKKYHAPEARRLLTLGLQKNPDHAAGWAALASVLKGMRDYPGALKAYAELERLRPEGVLHRTDYATLLMKSGDAKAAETVLRRAIAQRPDSRIVAGELANALQYQGRHAEAEAWYAYADRINAQEPITANNRGHNAMALGKLDEAKRWFDEAVKRDGLSPMGHFNLGTLALRNNDAKGALAHFDRALKVDDRFGQGYRARGRVRAFLGATQDALADFERFTRYSPRDPNSWFELARLYAQQANTHKALLTLREGLSQTQGHPKLKQALQAVQQGRPL